MYVHALYSKEADIINIVERVNGERIYKEFKPDHSFYVEDPRGTHKSIFGDTVSKLQPNSYKDKRRLGKLHGQKKTFEFDLPPIARCIEQNYGDVDPADLHVAFYDIETDFDKVLGYSTPDEAFNPVTSIAVYLQWMKQMICLAVPPKTLSWEEAQEIAKEVPDVILCKTESEMLQMFLTIIEDADVLSGWNSEFYDIPYTVNRVISQLGKHEARKMCLWDEMPRKKTVERFEKQEVVYELTGRVHLDYLELYKKYTYEERQSYKLDAIAEYELGEKKVEYPGTLDQLYNEDFKKFLEYNIQDTMLLEKLDKKLDFISLANTIAVGSSVLMPATMGAVAVTEQSIIKEAHRRDMMVPDKKQGDKGDTRAAGGWVQQPKKGLHHWVGSSDLNSLYPSVIRALNMSPETIVGQLETDTTNEEIAEWIASAKSHTFAGWWNDKFNTLEMQDFIDKNSATKHTFRMEDGSASPITGAELHEIVFKSGQPWCISANGTIFRTDIDGVIPGLLAGWYADRKAMKKILWNLIQLRTGLIDANISNDDITVPDTVPNLRKVAYGELDEYFKLEGAERAEFASKFGLEVRDGKFWAREEFVDKYKDAEGYWDKRQMVRKINLNSLYGGLLNEHCRFYDHRLGQSTTLTGRSITRHMAAKTNEFLTGEYTEKGESIIYGDTDSVYFSAYPIFKDQIEAGELEWNKEKVIELYDEISDMVSATFPQFMLDAFNVPIARSEGVIVAGREIVASTGLYIKKKRYAALVYDDEGKRTDVDGKPGKVKAMGLDLRRADTPVFVQEFLTKVLTMVLTEHTEEECIQFIKEFKELYDDMKPWEKGTPKAVNGVTKYMNKIEERNKQMSRGQTPKTLMVPGHVQGSFNWNLLRERYNDLHRARITDGSKVILCYLKDNDYKFKNIAYPVEENHLPDWFLDLPFDEELMLERGVDKKVENMLGVLKWDLSKASKQADHFGSLFEF